MHKKLFIPGPTEVRQDILGAQAKPLIGHRMKSFTELYTGIIRKLKELLKTNNFVTVLTASGTAKEDGQLIQIEAEPLRRLCEDNPGLGFKLMQGVAKGIMSRLQDTRVELAGQSYAT